METKNGDLPWKSMTSFFWWISLGSGNSGFGDSQIFVKTQKKNVDLADQDHHEKLLLRMNFWSIGASGIAESACIPLCELSPGRCRKISLTLPVLFFDGYRKPMFFRYRRMICWGHTSSMQILQCHDCASCWKVIVQLQRKKFRFTTLQVLGGTLALLDLTLWINSSDITWHRQ